MEASTEQASRASVGEARTPHQLPRRRSMTPTFVANAARRSSRLFGSRQRTEAPTFDGLQTFLQKQSEAAMLPAGIMATRSIYQAVREFEVCWLQPRQCERCENIVQVCESDVRPQCVRVVIQFRRM